MFDDLKQGNQSEVNNSSNQAQSTPTSVNTPRKSIDDMFGDVDPTPVQSAAVNNADKPSAVQSGKIKPVSQTNTPNIPTPMPSAPVVPKPQSITAPNIPPADSMMVSDDRSSGMVRKIIIAILVLVLLAVVGGGIYYFFLRTDGQEVVVEENSNTNNVVNNNTNLNNNTNDDEVIINEDELDDDFDGLDNGTERQLGTNPLEADSDNDGVFDQDEVEVYKTDPLSDDSDGDGLSDHEEIIIYGTDPNDPDTDGDTFLDGVEILNGYNPLGNGKLEDMETNNLNTNDNI